MKPNKTNKTDDFERRDFTLNNAVIERSAEDNTMRLIGHASVFDSESLDLGGFVEVVKPGAFKRSLEENDVHAFVNHNSDMVIGRNTAGTLRLFEDDKGLRTEIDLPDTSYARDLAVSVERGDITGMSFGFSVRAGGQTISENKDGKVLRELRDINLIEVSTTPIPAYPSTDVAKRSLGLAQPAAEHESFDIIDVGLEADTARMKMIRDSVVLRENRSQDWCEVRNKDENTVEILMYDAIGMSGTSAKAFVQELNSHKGKALHVRVNSPGGVITDGAAIYNALKRHDGPVMIDIDGLAASMAGIIAMAGDTVRMNHNAFFMMHNASTCVLGDANDLEGAAERLRKMNKSLAGTLSQRSGMDLDEVLAMMDKETWLDAKEAKAMGFVDEVMHETREDVRSHDVSQFRNVHAGYIEQRRSAVRQKRTKMKLGLLKAK